MIMVHNEADTAPVDSTDRPVSQQSSSELVMEWHPASAPDDVAQLLRDLLAEIRGLRNDLMTQSSCRRSVCQSSRSLSGLSSPK